MFYIVFQLRDILLIFFHEFDFVFVNFLQLLPTISKMSCYNLKNTQHLILYRFIFPIFVAHFHKGTTKLISITHSS